MWTSAGSLYDPHLYGIYDSDGNLIPGTTNDDGGELWNSGLTFTPSRDGTYYVSAGSSAPPDTNAGYVYEGTYTLRVRDLSDPLANINTSGRVLVGGSVTGEIESPRDHDWYAVTLEAGTTYRIDLTGRPTGDGSLNDPYLYGIHDSNGSRIYLTSNDDGGVGLNSQVTFTPEENGTYYVSAGAYHAATGTYMLSVEEL